MKRYNFILFLLSFLVVFWLILNSDFSLDNIAIGFIICILVLLVSHVYVVDSDLPDLSFFDIFIIIRFIFKTFMSILPSSFNVIKAILKKSSRVDRIELELPSNYKFINALVCNAITLTPGTITLEYYENKAEILVINPDNLSRQELISNLENEFKLLENL